MIPKLNLYNSLAIFLILNTAARFSWGQAQGEGTSEAFQSENDIPVVEGHGGTITFPIEDDVLILNDDNFDHAIATKENLLVEFYAPWCGHCKTLAPEYAKAAQILAKENSPIQLAKVDATLHDTLGARYEVSGYPTLIHFKNGEKHDYDGPRDARGIVEYLKERSDPNWKPPPSKVLKLTSENFTENVNKNELILVAFYVPGSGQYKRFAPEYDRASIELLELGITLAKVDGTKEVDVTNNLNITDMPALKIFRYGRVFEYSGPRHTQGIVKYMKEETIPASKAVDNLKQLKNSLSKVAPTVVGFFASPEDRLFPEYQTATYRMRGQYTFMHTFEKIIADHFKTKAGAVIVFQPEIFHSKFEKSRKEFSTEYGTAEQVVQFIEESAIPLVGHRHKKNLMLYKRLPQVVVYYDVNFDLQYRKATQIIRNKILEVANELRNVQFCVSNEEEFQDELKALGLDDSGEDVNVGFYALNGLRYPMEPTEDFEVENLKQFVKDTLAGKIKPFLKSQPIPRNNNGPVKIIVAQTFEDIVMQGDKDILIEFYAPWCGHCKALEPEYVKLAQQFKDNENLIITKMDATLNDLIPPFKVSGYPAIYFVPATRKDSPILYDEPDRSIVALTKFVNKHLNKHDSNLDVELEVDDNDKMNDEL